MRLRQGGPKRRLGMDVTAAMPPTVVHATQCNLTARAPRPDKFLCFAVPSSRANAPETLLAVFELFVRHVNLGVSPVQVVSSAVRSSDDPNVVPRVFPVVEKL